MPSRFFGFALGSLLFAARLLRFLFSVRFFLSGLFGGFLGAFFAALITFAAVVGFVKPSSLKNDAPAGPKKACDLTFAAFFDTLF